MDNEMMYRCENMIRTIERLNGKCEDNMRRLNEMMLEMKGIIAMVRPSARRNDWYKDELACDIIDKSPESMLCKSKENFMIDVVLKPPEC